MSSLNIKQGSDAHFPDYPLASPSNNEIDLLNLISVLWRAKKTVMAVVFAFACAGLLISFILPQKWTSAAVVTPPEPVQWQALEKTFTKLRVLDLDIKIDRTEAFNLFIKKFQSVSLLEEYLRSSPYVMDQLKEAKIDELDLHRAIVALSEKMKAVDDNASKKKDEPSLYTSWTLSFTAPTSEEAQTVLSGYIDYISALVVKESIENVRNKLEIKTQFEKEKLAQMAISNAKESDIDQALEMVGQSSADGIYIVDSYGALYPEQIRAIADKYTELGEKYGKYIGMHAHNNQQLAFANTIEALSHGVSLLDATMMSMGRGAGNCAMELLLSFLKNPKYNVFPVLRFLEDYMLPLKETGAVWGYDIPYLLTGRLNQHPSAAIDFCKDNRKDYADFYTDLLDK